MLYILHTVFVYPPVRKYKLHEGRGLLEVLHYSQFLEQYLTHSAYQQMKMPLFFSRPFTCGWVLEIDFFFTLSVIFRLTSSVKIHIPGPYPTELKSLRLGLQARAYVFPHTQKKPFSLRTI